jgi:transcriptional regulator with XRE-family HTH domain
VPKAIGPTIPRWQLGERLARYREAASMSQAAVADALGCSVSKVQKIEAGDVGVVRGELLLLLQTYGVDGEATRESLMALQAQGKQRGWWSKFGRVPGSFATFLGLESAATTIRIFEPLMVTGLLQTEAYARAISETWDGEPLPDQEVERQVKIKLERQKYVLEEDPPELWIILDEAVLRREIGGPAVMAGQLRKLATLAREITIQVVPFAQGGYPGVRGALTVFEFPDDRHSPVGYVETQAGNLYVEEPDDLRRCNLVLNHLTAAALSKRDSLKLISTVARAYAESAGSTDDARPIRRRVAQEHEIRQ